MTAISDNPAEKTRERLLLSILAATDALWTVHRHADSTAGAALEERRGGYRSGGVPWLGSYAAGAHAKDRKGVRALIETIGIGKLVQVGAGGSRVITIRLTDAGYLEARESAALPAMDDALLRLDQLFALRNDPRTYDHAGANWSRETHLAATEYGLPAVGEKLVELQELMLPLMVFGLVRYGTDIQGRVWYAATSKGQQLAAERLKANPATPRRRSAPSETQLSAPGLLHRRAGMRRSGIAPPTTIETRSRRQHSFSSLSLNTRHDRRKEYRMTPRIKIDNQPGDEWQQPIGPVVPETNRPPLPGAATTPQGARAAGKFTTMAHMVGKAPDPKRISAVYFIPDAEEK